ncbi:hypothetical protein B0I35DRAFT_477086 [Stachybotrys elegans]|uniref:N-acetyltransferase domain-containing protein n=1 Tax=Stachybotrys elegans TaxID=80388 RepID=A0A8K0T1U4_9HYPO|nr:hypothetical protein B0I35DRAFT_477086 [Stachybotrys elegans]
MPKIPIRLQPITAEATVPLRHAILWPDLPIDKQLMPLDTLPTTRHFGAFIALSEPGENIQELQGRDPSDPVLAIDQDYLPQAGECQLPVGVMTLCLEEFTNKGVLPTEITAAGPTEIQLHKFAVLAALQGLGIGGQMIRQVCQMLPTLDMDKAGSSGPSSEAGLKIPRPVLFHFHARKSQREVYMHWGFATLGDDVFLKRGPTGTGNPVEYIRMGRLITLG